MRSLSKTKKINIPKNIHEMSKEMLQETLKKKKECNAKALSTVEKLCEAHIDEDWFLANLQFINQCHFDDIIIERAISKMCGYPLCDQELSKVPAQQYHISTRYNKIFDITERKNFCSNTCYKSAMHVKMQLLTSPLWLRDVEVIPKFTILKSSKSSMGKEVVFFPEKIKLEQEDIKKTDSKNNITLNENVTTLENKCPNLNILNSELESHNNTETDALENLRDYKNNRNNLHKKIIAAKQDKVEDKGMQLNKAMDNMVNQKIVKENIKHICSTEKSRTEVKNKLSDIITKIEKVIFEWFSLETIFYLYEEEKLKELYQEKSIKIKEILNTKLSVSDCSNKINKMIQLYGLLEIDSFSSSENKMNLKPVPDYSSLKEEGKNLEIKVRAFYQGNLEVIVPREEVKTEYEESKTNSNPTYLPAIHSHDQNALRKKIVLDKLNKILPELIKLFSSDFVLKMSEVRGLVTTFSLAAHNITFKPREWYLIGVIIIKLLCLRDKELDSIIKLESSESQMSLILMSYELQNHYLDDLLLRLTLNENSLEKLKTNK